MSTTATLTREAIMALEAGPEIDALVAERVMGWTFGCTPDPEGDWASWNEPRPDDPTRQREVKCAGWSPSTDIAAAWEVVEKMRPTHVGSLWTGIDEGHNACFGMYEYEERWAKADSMPLAICRAALLATLEAAQ